MGRFATGVTIVTVDREGEVHGMTANALASVSLDPVMLLVCVDRAARIHAHMHARKRFGINVLSEKQRLISEYYARPDSSHERAEAEAGATFERTQHGTPMLQGSLAYFECCVEATHDAGDHTIFIARVEHAIARQGEPLLFFRGKYSKAGDRV